MSCGRSCAAAITALILVLPVGGAAQAPVLPSDAASSTTPAQQKRRIPSHQYLDEAARVMTMIPETSFKGDGQKKLAELRKHFAELISAYDRNPDPFVYPAVPGDDDVKSAPKTDLPNWKKAFTEVETDLAAILGGDSAVPSPVLAPSTAAVPVNTAGTAATPDNTAVGTAGQARAINAGSLAGAVGAKNLDPEIRRQLEQFRLNVELFFAATTMNLQSEATR